MVTLRILIPPPWVRFPVLPHFFWFLLQQGPYTSSNLLLVNENQYSFQESYFDQKEYAFTTRSKVYLIRYGSDILQNKSRGPPIWEVSVFLLRRGEITGIMKYYEVYL